MKYEIKELRKIAVENLQPGGDAGCVPAFAGDREAIAATIVEDGLLEPLTVVAHEMISGRYCVIDGVGRFEAAKAAGIEAVDCIIVECGDERTFAYLKNGMRRKLSSGARILCYVMAHWEKICTVSSNEDTVRAGAGTFQKDAWSDRSISERLNVSKDDVGNAIYLYRIHSMGVDENGDPVGENILKAAATAFENIFSGDGSVRRIKSALAGGETGSQKGSSGKQSKRYDESLKKASISIRNTFEHWNEFEFSSPEKSQLVYDNFKGAIAIAPDTIRGAVIEAVSDWPEISKKYLLKRLKYELAK